MMKFTSDTPHFFKVILEKTMREGKIMVPKQFVMKYGDGIPNAVQLTVPSGETFCVKLSKRDGEVWIKKGWKEFSDFYSLTYGHIVIFRYKGGRHFDVVICDMTASEIDYPFYLRPEKKFVDKTEGESSSAGEKRNKPELSPPLPEKTTVSEQPSPSPYKRVRYLCPEYITVREAPPKTAPNPNHDIIPPVVQQARKPIKDYTSKYPYFKTVMKEVHFTGRHSVLVPAHMRKRVNKTDTYMELHVGNRSWAVKYRNYARECILSYGWKFFAEENSLKVGDVCVFEHIPDSNDFIVEIIRDGRC